MAAPVPERDSEVVVDVLMRKVVERPTLDVVLRPDQLDPAVPGEAARDDHSPSFAATASLTAFGLALPPVAFIT